MSSVGNRPFGRAPEEISRRHQDDEREGQRQRAARHHPRERSFIEAEPCVIKALGGLVEPAVLLAVVGLEEAARQHRRQCQRHEAGDENRDADRDGELVEQLADDAAHEQERDEHRGERERHRQNREADFGRAVDGRLHARFAHLEMAHDVLEHHDRVVDHEADGERERHQRQVVEAVVQQVHHRERADDRHRQRETRDDRRRPIPEEQEDDEHDQQERELERERHVVDRRLNGRRPVVQRGHFDGRRDLGLQPLERRLHAVRDVHGVRARLALDREHDGARAVVPARRLVVLHVVRDAADLLEVHRRAVAVRDDDVAELVRVLELAGRLHRQRRFRAVEHARRHVHVLRRDRVGHVLERDVARRELVRVELQAHGVLLRAVDQHLRHATHHRESLRQRRLAELVERRQRHFVRRQRQRQDRRVGGIRLLIRRRDDALRQAADRLRDRRLHVLRGRVDVPVERELHDDLRLPEARRRRHVVDAGDRRERLLERRRDRCGHRLRARARQRGAHRHGRKVDVRQVAHRQLPVRDDSEDEDADHDERRHDGAFDEQRREIH